MGKTLISLEPVRGNSALMIPEIDIYRAANILVKRYGEDAALEAAQRADVMLERSDMDGYAVWKSIVRAVEEMQRIELAAGEVLQ